MSSDTTCTAIQIVLPRIKQAEEKTGNGSQEQEYTLDLAVGILHAALACHTFTLQQQQRLTELAQAYSLPLPSKEASLIPNPSAAVDFSDTGALNTTSVLDSASLTASRSGAPVTKSDRPIDELAKEFGIDTHVVEALAQRLAMLN